MSRQRRRMAVAVLAVVGLFVSLYLLLYKLGFYGSLACGPGGSCEVVQASRYSDLLGVPVAGWGVAWYAAVLALSLLLLRPDLADRPGLQASLRLLAVVGLAVVLYLTGVEIWVLEAICRWCVAGAVVTALIFGVVMWGWYLEASAGAGGRER